MNDIKLISGPMATLSHQGFRQLVENFGGCDEFFTEMINASSLVNMGPFEKYYIMNQTAPEKTVWQLTGNNAESFCKALPIIFDRGGLGIDINMGCSAPQIYKTGAGIDWMMKPMEETEKLVKSVKDVLIEHEMETGKHYRLSVKCRLGKDDFKDDDFFAFTDMLAENGVELITLHARTLKEKYRGLPKYSYVQRLKERYGEKMKTYLNGAVESIESLEYALKCAPSSDGVMIARRAAIEPWIFAKLKGQHMSIDREKTALDFMELTKTNQPEEFHRTRIQRFFSYYCQQFKFGHYFATQMTNYKSLEDSASKVKDYFLKQPDEKILEF